MWNNNIIKLTTLLSFVLLASVATPQLAEAHCDSMDGPVVKAAQKALETGNVNLVLIWVYPEQEAEVRTAFQKTLNVRDTNEEVREMADMYFFETLVRLHRESEGAPYTGIKPAGTDFGPAIPAADKALETGSLQEVRDLLIHAFEEGLQSYFKEASGLQNFNPNNIEAGRKYVEAYVKYTHYIEPIYEIVSSGASHHTHAHAH